MTDRDKRYGVEARTGLTAVQAAQIRDALERLAAADADLGGAVIALAGAVAGRLDAQERALGGPPGRLAGEIRELGGAGAARRVAAALADALGGPAVPAGEWAMDGVCPERWRVPPPGDPDERRVIQHVARDLGRRGEAELLAHRLLAPDLEEDCLLASGAEVGLLAEMVVPCRILALVVDEPAGLDVTYVAAGRAELALAGPPVPASVFSATTCAACRDRACQALAGKRWPRLLAGQRLRVGVRNASADARLVRVLAVCEEERVEVVAPGGSAAQAPAG